MTTDKVRVAVVGGGCAGMAAAFELSKADLADQYEVTVYQMGWRLGGKGASGRGDAARIEEHGLHLWMGYYENAFRLMRDCYAELDRGPECPISDWRHAFVPSNFNVAADWSPSGRWLPWKVLFPALPGLPGDGDPDIWSVPDYLSRSAALVRTLLQTVRTDHGAPVAPSLGDILRGEASPEALSDVVKRIAKQGILVGLGAVIESLRLLETVLRSVTRYPQSSVLALLDAVDHAVTAELEKLIAQDDALRRLWEVADIVIAVIRGSIKCQLAFDERGFDAIDHMDSRKWLQEHGASERSINSAFLRALYDLAFAYDKGSAKRPSFSAGAALRGGMRAFFTYRGAFFWKMTAGMGDVVFAPLYEVLKRRGVKFEYFHKLTNVGLAKKDAEGRRHVGSLCFDVQARTTTGSEYQPLVDVLGLPCWPSQPDLSQLAPEPYLEDAAWEPESQWDDRACDKRELLVDEDFDAVVLAIGLGAVPIVCRELIVHDERWKDMAENTRSVPTQAFQLWLRPRMSEFGWDDGPTNLSGFVEPFDTWADMTHLGVAERWDRSPGAIAYFCNVLPDEPGVVPGEEFLAQSKATVRENAIKFLNEEIVHIWPEACERPGRFRWDTLIVPENGVQGVDGEARIDTQYLTANVRPSDRYSQAHPGTARYRISPLDRTFGNLSVAGDWTDSGLNMGCVEAAVMSGQLAANSIAQAPRLSEIVGFDHP